MDSAQAVQNARQPRRSRAERRAIVEETMKPGMSVARVAISHGINPNQVFMWRKLYQAGRLNDKVSPTARLLPVKISGMTTKLEAVKGIAQREAPKGIITIDLGHAQVRIEGNADPECVRAVFEGLGR